MIIDFSIQNFGSVKDKQTLSFEADKSVSLEDFYVIKSGKYRLLKLALIYGANASGKTTILNALEFLSELIKAPNQKKTDQLKFAPYLFDESTAKKNSILSVNFIEQGIHYFYKIEFNNKYISREELYFYSPKKAQVYIRTTDVKKQLTKITFGSKVKISKVAEEALIANTLWNNSVLAGFFRTNVDTKEIKRAADWFETFLKALIKPNSDLTQLSSHIIIDEELWKIRKEDIIGILNKADFNISDIEVNKEDRDLPEHLMKYLEKRNLSDEFIDEVKNKMKLKFDLLFKHSVNGKSYSLPFLSESRGTQRYFGLAGILALLIKDSSLVTIDELESSLHPDLYMHFILSFLTNSKESQLIATTHNREILDHKDVFRNDAIWFTDKSSGATELYSLADFDSSVVRDTSNVYNAYKIGKLGAVPHLSDYYIELSNEN